MAVIGGGYIGVELAGVFKALGTETHLFTRGDKPLKDFDSLIVDTLMSEMKKQQLIHHANIDPKEIKKSPEGKLFLHSKSGETFGPYDQVFFLIFYFYFNHQ